MKLYIFDTSYWKTPKMLLFYLFKWHKFVTFESIEMDWQSFEAILSILRRRSEHVQRHFDSRPASN